MKIIAGPCQHESYEQSLDIAAHCKDICDAYDIDYVFKASFDKANRTAVGSKRGIGLDNTLGDFRRIKEELEDVLTLTDIHDVHQVYEIVNQYNDAVDVLQIPAFLSRQTDLITAACSTDKAVNIKKGQFMSPLDIRHIIHKCKQSRPNLDNLMITERGTSFGYNNLVVDMTGLQTMKEIITKESDNVRLVIDGTHAVQKPGALDGKSGGNREYVPNLVKAALTYGLGGVFMEVHDDPDNAPSDGPNAVHIRDLSRILQELQEYDQFVKYNY